MKTYLAAICNLQISLGFPDPQDTSSLPRLKLVLMGIRRLQSRSRANAARIRLPITFSILSSIKKVWEDAGVDHDRLLLWAAATVCFFGFFRSGEIPVPSTAAFDPTIHLSWGDVAVDDPANPSVIRFFLKRSKCDQFGSGVEVFVGKTGVCSPFLGPGLSPHLYMGSLPVILPKLKGLGWLHSKRASRCVHASSTCSDSGPGIPFFTWRCPRPIFQRLSWETADEVCVYTGGPERSYNYRFASQPICWPQLPDRRSYSSSPGWIGRLCNSGSGPLV